MALVCLFSHVAHNENIHYSSIHIITALIYNSITEFEKLFEIVNI